jgi:hypothetical protein
MQARTQYFEALELFANNEWEKWNEEQQKLEAYIEKQKGEGNSVVHLTIRLNNGYKRMEAVQKLLMLASQAINEKPSKQQQQQTGATFSPNNRTTIADMPDGDSWRVKKILSILENVFNY